MAFVIRDNFPLETARALRQYAMDCETQHRYDGGYDIIEFWYDSDPLLANAVDIVRSTFADELDGHPFQQGWFFIYDEECDGVDLHADPGALNVNIWLTPNDAIKDWDKNGLIVYDAMIPDDWSWDDYNTDPAKIALHLADCNAVPRTVSYRYRRTTLFDSRLFHKTNGVCTKPGLDCKRVNCTMLFS